MNRQFNGRNINTINFNYRHLHRLGIRGGMEYVTFFPQDASFCETGSVLAPSSPDYFGPSGEKYGLLYVQEPVVPGDHNTLKFVDNQGNCHSLAGGSNMAYWTRKNPTSAAGSMIGPTGHIIRPLYGPDAHIRQTIVYNANASIE